jgi:hypothetical protein
LDSAPARWFRVNDANWGGSGPFTEIIAFSGFVLFGRRMSAHALATAYFPSGSTDFDAPL